MKPHWVLLTVLFLAACGPSNRTTAVESGLEEYVKQARMMRAESREMSGSLWSEDRGYADAFRDVKARRAGDIVTVEVLETTSAVTEASTGTVRKEDSSASIAGLFGLEKRIGELPGLVDTSRSNQFSGEASTERKSVLQTRIAARVVEVFPNGFLLLEGNREIAINGERQLVTVRGVVRPEDISPQNSVLSTRIAELEVQVQGRGIVSQAQEPGILYKIVNGIWPF